MKGEFLNRYTSLPFLLDILQSKTLTMKNPELWEDKNDSYFIKLYKQKSLKETVLVLCFVEYQSKSDMAEKYHNWKIYVGNLDGVCILFDKKQLISSFNGYKFDYMSYKQLDKLKQKAIV
jgi:hypothetical protein